MQSIWEAEEILGEPRLNLAMIYPNIEMYCGWSFVKTQCQVLIDESISKKRAWVIKSTLSCLNLEIKLMSAYHALDDGDFLLNLKSLEKFLNNNFERSSAPREHCWSSIIEILGFKYFFMAECCYRTNN